MAHFTLAEGMALLWRVFTRRAGRRTLATAAVAAVLWFAAVALLLPPSRGGGWSQSPANRRIHQQPGDQDYTATRLRQDGRNTSAGARGTGAVADEGKAKALQYVNRYNELIQSGVEARQELSPRSDGAVDTIGGSGKVSVPEQRFPRTLPHERALAAPRPISPDSRLDRNVVFAPILGNGPAQAALPAAASIVRTATDGSTEASEGTRDDDQPDARGNTGSDELEWDGKNTVAERGVEAGAVNNSEGPYTLPILKTPSDSASVPQKRSSGYLSRRGSSNSNTPPASTQEDDWTQGNVVVPFMVAKGPFRNIGGVFPIHPVEFQHPGGMMGDIQKEHDKAETAQEKAQIIAMAAIEHGHKITQHQQDMINKLSPNKKKQLEIRSKEMRMKQEKAYLLQLRARGQVVPLAGGGEMVMSAPRLMVRFPTMLKKLQPEEWPPEYQVYLNITHSPWGDSECDGHVTRFTRPHSLPTRAIASFPSSGNTWIRYLVEGATGIYTGSLYDDSSLTRKGLYGEAVPYNTGMTLLQKTHGYTTGEAMREGHRQQLKHNHFYEIGCRGLVIVRNPFKALISHRHLDIGGHTGYAPRTQFQGEGWAEFVKLKIKLWEDFYRDWLLHCPSEDVYVTHYETLKSDLKPELTNILNFLHVPIDKHRLACVQLHSDGLFKRKPSKNVPENINYYPRELKDMIYGAIDRLNSVLDEKGKKELPIDLYEMYDATEAKISRDQNSDRQTVIVP